MQTKSISKLIHTKISEWIESINDTELRADLKKHVLVSGGSITTLYLGEQVNDFDVYLMDRPTLMALTEYYVKPYKGRMTILDGNKRDEYIEKYQKGFSDEAFAAHPGHYASVLRNLRDGQIKIYMSAKGGGYKVDPATLKLEQDGTPSKYQPSFFSPNAISLTGDVQVVIRFWGTPEEVHKTFDFIHATNYWTFSAGVVLNTPALESLLTKQLKYQGSFYPVTSIILAKKFMKRGFNINAGELLKIIFQVSLLDLTNMDVLEEQLIGVDVAYFEILIEALRDRQENDPEFKISAEYFNSMIDKIFNKHEDSD